MEWRSAQRDGRPVDGPGALRNAVALLTPGAEVELVLLREGQRRTLKVVMGTRADDSQAPTATRRDTSDLGFRSVPLTDEIARRLGVEAGKGLLITEVGPATPAARAGLRPGQLLLSVDRKPVNDEAALGAALEAASDAKALLLRLRDSHGSRYVVLERE